MNWKRDIRGGAHKGSQFVSRVSRSIVRGLGSIVSGRPSLISWPGGVISFTFDDFPKSALATGHAILARHRVRATYYVAARLAGTTDEVGRMFDIHDIRVAHADGHEIGCHTYTHLNCSEASESDLLEQVHDNATALASVLGDFAPMSFAYPYGAVSSLAKRVLGPRFSSCRGISGGINRVSVNFAELRANRIYSREFDEAQFRGLIDQNSVVGGWLIFYTHDVETEPSRFGCTPEQFEAIVSYAAARSTILPIGDVTARLGRPTSGRRFI